MTRAIVVCPNIKAEAQHQQRSITAKLEEAINLCDAIALDVVQGLIFPVQKIRPSTVLGTGQIEHIAELAVTHAAELLVVDTALTPMQQRNLERATSIKVIDRSALILEIFGERARTKEGKLQVELAALEYQKSRLVRSWTHLERQRGGVGFMGGPGESQIETDRRLIRERIASLKKQLEKVVRTRGLHRHLRDSVPYPTVALVGYTNAGKSTLFNRLTHANVLAQDALFATLDPTTRRVVLPSGIDILLSDTVGFVSELPTQLIAAFRATLEEVRQADILLHVRDITHQDTQAQRDDVMQVVTGLFDETEDMPPMIEVWNKVDIAPEAMRSELMQASHDVVGVSAITGQGISALMDAIDATLIAHHFRQITFRVPVTDGKALAWLHHHGVVSSSNYDDNQHVMVDVRLSPADIARFGQEFHYQAYDAMADMPK